MPRRVTESPVFPIRALPVGVMSFPESDQMVRELECEPRLEHGPSIIGGRRATFSVQATSRVRSFVRLKWWSIFERTFNRDCGILTYTRQLEPSLVPIILKASDSKLRELGCESRRTGRRKRRRGRSYENEAREIADYTRRKDRGDSEAGHHRSRQARGGIAFEPAGIAAGSRGEGLGH